MRVEKCARANGRSRARKMAALKKQNKISLIKEVKIKTFDGRTETMSCRDDYLLLKRRKRINLKKGVIRFMSPATPRRKAEK